MFSVSIAIVFNFKFLVKRRVKINCETFLLILLKFHCKLHNIKFHDSMFSLTTHSTLWSLEGKFIILDIWPHFLITQSDLDIWRHLSKETFQSLYFYKLLMIGHHLSVVIVNWAKKKGIFCFTDRIILK